MVKYLFLFMAEMYLQYIIYFLADQAKDKKNDNFSSLEKHIR